MQRLLVSSQHPIPPQSPSAIFSNSSPLYLSSSSHPAHPRVPAPSCVSASLHHPDSYFHLAYPGGPLRLDSGSCTDHAAGRREDSDSGSDSCRDRGGLCVFRSSARCRARRLDSYLCVARAGGRCRRRACLAGGGPCGFYRVCSRWYTPHLAADLYPGRPSDPYPYLSSAHPSHHPRRACAPPSPRRPNPGSLVSSSVPPP